jgi:hypothetical protein
MKILAVLVVLGICCTALAQISPAASGDAEEKVAGVQKQWLRRSNTAMPLRWIESLITTS